MDEMAFLLRPALRPVPRLNPALTFSPHQDLISERLATLWRIQQRDRLLA
jgi:transcription-repair coupling factor (superfamily II helicase)